MTGLLSAPSNKTHYMRLTDLDKKSSLFRFALLGFHYISDLFISNQLRLIMVLYRRRALSRSPVMLHRIQRAWLFTDPLRVKWWELSRSMLALLGGGGKIEATLSTNK